MLMHPSLTRFRTNRSIIALVVQMTPLHAGIGVAVWFLAVARPAAALPDASTYLPGELLIKLRPAQSGATPQAVSQACRSSRESNLADPGLAARATAGRNECARGDRVLPQPAWCRLRRAELSHPPFRHPERPAQRRPRGLDNINASQAWDQTTGNAAIVVATIDTGIDYTQSNWCR